MPPLEMGRAYPNGYRSEPMSWSVVEVSGKVVLPIHDPGLSRGPLPREVHDALLPPSTAILLRCRRACHWLTRACSARTLKPAAELGHTKDARTMGSRTTGPRARHGLHVPSLPTPSAWNGPARLAELFAHQGDASNVEAALGTSHRLTGTASPRDPDFLNGRGRGTEVFLGRGARSPQSAGPRSKAQPTDTVDVFGAASAATATADKPQARVKSFAAPSLLDATKKKRLLFRIPRCAHLTSGALDVTSEAIDEVRRLCYPRPQVASDGSRQRHERGRSMTAVMRVHLRYRR